MCNLHVCVLSALCLGHLYGTCDWDVLVALAFCLWLPWGIICLREVLPAFPLPPMGKGAGVGKPALFPQLVPPSSAVCEVEVGLTLNPKP